MFKMSDRIKRAIVIATIPVAAICAVPAVATASPIAPVMAASSTMQALDMTPEIRRHWWGIVVRFNKEQTGLINTVGGLYGASRFVKWAIQIGGASWLAGEAIDRGNCVEVVIPAWSLVPGASYGRGAHARIWGC